MLPRRWPWVFVSCSLACSNGVSNSSGDTATAQGDRGRAGETGTLGDVATPGDLAAPGDQTPPGDSIAPGDSAESIPWVAAPVNVPAGQLCDIPVDYIASGGDPVNITCAVESDTLSVTPSVIPASLRVVAWNVHFGAESATVLAELQTHPQLANADFLLLSEVARRDLKSNPASINQARELAIALGMNYAFAVGWDRRDIVDATGEHGNAILSKYPLGNIRVIRHTPDFDWYGKTGRFGGRLSLVADAKIGARYVRLYASHFDNRPTPPDVLPSRSVAARAVQGAELRADADAPDRPTLQVVGGDLNAWNCYPMLSDCTGPPAAETVVEDFLDAGWLDGTGGLNFFTYEYRSTIVVVQRLDWIFYPGSFVPQTVT